MVKVGMSLEWMYTLEADGLAVCSMMPHSPVIAIIDPLMSDTRLDASAPEPIKWCEYLAYWDLARVEDEIVSDTLKDYPSLYAP